MARIKKVKKYQNAPAPIKRSTVNGEKIREIYEKNKSVLDSARKKNMNVLDEMYPELKPKLETISSNNYRPVAPKQKTGGKVTKAKDGKWIQKATASIKKRGTEGVCTGKKFGGPTCKPGSKRYNLAKVFKGIAKKKK